MSNSIALQLDVLASSPEEMSQIESALQDPFFGDSLIADLCAEGWDRASGNIMDHLKKLSLTPTIPSDYGELRFTCNWEDKYVSPGWGHVKYVSSLFPGALFLAKYWGPMLYLGGTKVIHEGKVIRHLQDDNYAIRTLDWARLDISSPFRVEYDLGLKNGSLWTLWVQDVYRQLAYLADSRCGEDLEGSVESREGQNDEGSTEEATDGVTE